MSCECPRSLAHPFDRSHACSACTCEKQAVTMARLHTYHTDILNIGDDVFFFFSPSFCFFCSPLCSLLRAHILGRGISPATVMDFQLGYSPEDFASPLVEYLDQVYIYLVYIYTCIYIRKKMLQQYDRSFFLFDRVEACFFGLNMLVLVWERKISQWGSKTVKSRFPI